MQGWKERKTHPPGVLWKVLPQLWSIAVLQWLSAKQGIVERRVLRNGLENASIAPRAMENTASQADNLALNSEILSLSQKTPSEPELKPHHVLQPQFVCLWSSISPCYWDTLSKMGSSRKTHLWACALLAIPAAVTSFRRTWLSKAQSSLPATLWEV